MSPVMCHMSPVTPVPVTCHPCACHMAKCSPDHLVMWPLLTNERQWKKGTGTTLHTIQTSHLLDWIILRANSVKIFPTFVVDMRASPWMVDDSRNSLRTSIVLDLPRTEPQETGNKSIHYMYDRMYFSKQARCSRGYQTKLWMILCENVLLSIQPSCWGGTGVTSVT